MADHLVTARDSLVAVISSSRSISHSINAPSRFDQIQRRLSSLSAATRPILADEETLLTLSTHIDRALSPAEAVLKVFDAVHRLESSLLSDPSCDLPAYLSLLQRLEEALRFLRDNCGLAVQWLEGIVDYVKNNSVADERYTLYLKNLLNSIKDSKSKTDSPLDGGLLDAALDNLGSEFQRILVDHSFSLSISDLDESIAISSPPLPNHVVQNLISILQILELHCRIEGCVKVYADVRGRNVNSSLRALGLDYLEMKNSDFKDVQSIEKYIVIWAKHLEFAIKHLLEEEYKLCSDVFEDFCRPELWIECFADIAAQAGILTFLRFGMTVTESKKDPIKLLKLLDIFRLLNKLRVDFNRLFGGNSCVEIQSLTRELIKRLIDGSCEIFWELSVQVELHRQVSPPLDGGVPKLVTFVTNYCNKLLSKEYKPILTQVLMIHKSWKREKFQSKLLTDYIESIIQALVKNIETWSKTYEDIVISCLFLMNSHWLLYRDLKGTAVGELLGLSWLKEQELSKDFYATKYMRESWGKLPPLVSREGLMLFSGGRATARDLVKKRLKVFNEAFDDLYKKQSQTVILDRELREQICELVIQSVVPVYKSYLQNYGPLVEQEEMMASKYVKYTAESLEDLLRSLFQSKKQGRSMSFAARQSNGKVI